MVLGDLKFEAALDHLAGLGVQAVELVAGGYARSAHCPLDSLLASEKKRRALLHAVASRGLQISALNAAGNPLHPRRGLAAGFDRDYRKVVRLAAQLGVGTVITFSGCPGGAPGDRTPNWVTCPWPPDYLEILQYQWDKVVIPYWSKTAEWTRREGIRRWAG